MLIFLMMQMDVDMGWNKSSAEKTGNGLKFGRFDHPQESAYTFIANYS